MLLQVARDSGTAAPIKVFGPTAPASPLPAGIEYAGWAESLEEIYDGPTGVIVTNIGGTGVPNKLIEALDRNRVTVVHRSLQHHVPSTDRAWFFSDARGLALALAQAEGGFGSEFGVQQGTPNDTWKAALLA